ncbi:MAG: glycosyltransferase family 4 protein [Pirellulaceae bacterium]
MKISYIQSICVLHDAISDAIRNEIVWLTESQAHDVKLYCYKCDFDFLPYTLVNSMEEIAFDPHFQSSDLVVFHFGIFYPLFNLIAFSAAGTRRLVVFHNITPKQVVSVESHPTIDRSMKQMANIVFADHVVCDSQTNLDVLRGAGIRTSATVLPLPVHDNLVMPRSKPSHSDRLIRLAFIGRFVKAKGPGDLLQALQMLVEMDSTLNIALDMVGNLLFSEADVLREMQARIETIHAASRHRIRVSIQFNASEQAKHHILRDADLFVLPTYHEGFCVPILEALATGCRVVAYDNSNIPAVSGGFARLTATGDVAALARAIAEVVGEIKSSAWRGTGPGSYIESQRDVQEYVSYFSQAHTRDRFLEFIRDFANS